MVCFCIQTNPTLMQNWSVFLHHKADLINLKAFRTLEYKMLKEGVRDSSIFRTSMHDRFFYQLNSLFYRSIKDMKGYTLNEFLCSRYNVQKLCIIIMADIAQCNKMQAQVAKSWQNFFVWAKRWHLKQLIEFSM